MSNITRLLRNNTSKLLKSSKKNSIIKPLSSSSILSLNHTSKRNYEQSVIYEESDESKFDKKPFYKTDTLPDIQTEALDVDPTDYRDVATWPTCRFSGLSNGVRIASENLPWNNNSVSIGVFVDAGSRYETNENNGCAHFLEHLAFKGTNRRSREQLEQEVENIGGHLNAYTSREQTVYFAQVLQEDTEQALDILSDIILNSTLDRSAIDRERAVILQEMDNVYSETKEELIFDNLHENCFQDCNLGRTILGPVENIKRINRDDLQEYINTYYTADNIAIVAAGAVDHDRLHQLVEQKFSSVQASGAGSGKRPYKDTSYFRGCEYQERWDDMPYVYLAYAYETCPWNSPDTYPLMFMQQMIGQWDKRLPGGMYHTSPTTRYLYSDMSRPISESYMAFNTPYTDTGLWGVYGVVHPYDLFYWLHATRKEVTRFGYDVNEAMIEDVRERLKATMLLSLGNTTQLMEDIGRQVLVHGRRIHPMESFQRVNAVDENAIKTVAHRYLIDRDHAMVAVGPVHEMMDYQAFRQRSSMFF